MQDIRERNLKISFANWITLGLVAGISVLFLAAELLQYNPLSNFDTSTSENPIDSELLSNVETLKFENRITGATLKQMNRNDWMITEPKTIPASFEQINSLLTALATVKVNKIHQLEPLNQAAFSLNRPLATISITTRLQEQLTVKVGLVNPINNSTYIEIPEKNAIYQVSNLSLDVTSLSFTDLIDARVFRNRLNELEKITIFNRKGPSKYIEFESNGALWSTLKYNTVNQANVVDTLKELLNIKAFMILDQLEEKAQKVVEKYQRSILYTVRLQQDAETETTYRISTLVKSIPGVKFDKRQYFLVWPSNRNFPYLVHKDNLKSIQIKYSDLK
jgi:hypothetical protein